MYQAKYFNLSQSCEFCVVLLFKVCVLPVYMCVKSEAELI